MGNYILLLNIYEDRTNKPIKVTNSHPPTYKHLMSQDIRVIRPEQFDRGSLKKAIEKNSSLISVTKADKKGLNCNEVGKISFFISLRKRTNAILAMAGL